MADVSVIIPTYNRLGYLQEAIASALQGNDDLAVEVLVVDDGSTDGTREWLTSLSDARVRTFFQQHHGAPQARNRGLRQSSAEYIKFLDDDDRLEPGALRTQLRAIGNMGDREIPYGRVGWINEKGASIGEGRHRVRRGNEDDVVHLMLSNIMTASPLHRRESIIAVDGFDATLDSGQEYELHLRLAASGYRFQFFDDLIYHQRHHLSPNRINSTNRLLIDRMYGMKHLDRTLEMLARMTDGNVKPEWVVQLSRLYWSYGREMLRMRDAKAAEAYFRRARQLGGGRCFPDPWYYRAVAKVFGPQSAEWASAAWIRALRRNPASALDLLSDA